jgi:X-X-X-Leu-X-X-Gly heptad repeat protein
MTTDSFESFFDSYDSYDSSEYAERGPRRGGGGWNRGVPTPNPTSSMPRRPTGNHVTEGQLNAAVDKLDGKITTLSNGVKTLETRTNTVASEQDRMGSAFRKEVEERKKALDAVQKDLQSTKMMSLLLPMLTQKPVTVATAGGGSTQVLTQPNDSLTTLLPFMLLMGNNSGGSSGSGGMFGGDSSSMMMMMVLLTRR